MGGRTLVYANCRTAVNEMLLLLTGHCEESAAVCWEAVRSESYVGQQVRTRSVSTAGNGDSLQ